MQHPSTPNVPKNHLMPDGGDGDWADYNRLKAQTYDPVHRSIYDSFRYADLTDPNDRLLVEALAQLCDIQLFARCNQQTYRVRSEYRLIDAINLVLSSYDLPMEAPGCLTIPGGDGAVWLWPVYAEAKNKGEEDEDAEDVGEEEDAGVSTETAEPEEWWRPAAASGDRPVRWMVRSWEELETPFPFSRTDANKDNADIWSVPPTPVGLLRGQGGGQRPAGGAVPAEAVGDRQRLPLRQRRSAGRPGQVTRGPVEGGRDLPVPAGGAQGADVLLHHAGVPPRPHPVGERRERAGQVRGDQPESGDTGAANRLAAEEVLGGQPWNGASSSSRSSASP